MKKIVGIVSVLALASAVFAADPVWNAGVFGYSGAYNIDYKINLDEEKMGFENGEADMTLNYNLWSGGDKVTSGDGLWGELKIVSDGTNVWGTNNVLPAAVRVDTAKIHFVDGDTWVNMNIKNPDFSVGGIEGAVVYHNSSWNSNWGWAGKDGSAGTNGFTLNAGIPMADFTVAFGDLGVTAMKDKVYAYKAAATVRPVEGLGIGAGISNSTAKDNKPVIAANASYKYAIDDVNFVNTYGQFIMQDKEKAVNAAVTYAWNNNVQNTWTGFVALNKDEFKFPNGGDDRFVDGVSVIVEKPLSDAAGNSVKGMNLTVAAFDSVLLNKVIPGSTKVACKYTAKGEELGKGALAAAFTYGNSIDIVNVSAKASFGMDLAADKDNTAVAYELGVNTDGIIQNTNLYTNYAASVSKYTGEANNKKGTITVGAKIHF